MLVPAPKPKLASLAAVGNLHEVRLVGKSVGSGLQELIVMRGSPPLSGVLVASTNPGSGFPKLSVKMLAGFSLTSCGPKSVRLRVKPMRTTLSHVVRE